MEAKHQAFVFALLLVVLSFPESYAIVVRCPSLSSFAIQGCDSSESQIFVPTPIYNMFLGNQSVIPTAATYYPVVLADSNTICSFDTANSSSSSSGMKNRIVVFENNPLYFYALKQEQELMLCAMRGGAVAVVILSRDFTLPGFGFAVSRHVKNELNIPVFHGVESDFLWIVRALEANQEILAEITADENKWSTLFASDLFFWLWRVFLPVVNTFGIAVNIWALFLHALRRRKFQNGKGPVRGNPIMILGNVIELASCAIRAIYCAVGPMFSSPTFDYNTHTFLLNITLSLEFASSFIAAVLFLRWGAFGHLRCFRIIEVALLASTCSSVPLQIVIALIQTLNVVDMRTLIFANGLLAIIMDTLSGFIFLHTGSKFVKQLTSKVGDFKSLPLLRKRSLRKATKWLMISGAMQLVICIGLAMVLRTNFFFTPLGWFLSYTLIYFGVTGQAITQSFSFKPLVPTEVAHRASSAINHVRGIAIIVAPMVVPVRRLPPKESSHSLKSLHTPIRTSSISASPEPRRRSLDGTMSEFTVRTEFTSSPNFGHLSIDIHPTRKLTEGAPDRLDSRHKEFKLKNSVNCLCDPHLETDMFFLGAPSPSSGYLSDGTATTTTTTTATTCDSTGGSSQQRKAFTVPGQDVDMISDKDMSSFSSQEPTSNAHPHSPPPFRTSTLIESPAAEVVSFSVNEGDNM